MNPKTGAVVCLGTFDGVHRGHLAVIDRGRRLARRRGLPVLAASFDRPPRFHFQKSEIPYLLSTVSEKIQCLRAAGADGVDVLSFNDALARVPPGEFLDRFVGRRWKTRDVVVGYDFRFGRNRAGTLSTLKAWAGRRRVGLHVVPPVKYGGKRVASGDIRTLLRQGALREALRALGHPYVLEAPVVSGRGLGAKLGFPTANLRAPAPKILPPGVFAVRVRLPSLIWRGGICNIGNRPTLGPRGTRTVEVHLLDYTGDLRGQILWVEFLHRLRAERRFASLAALKRQIALDERRARVLLAKGPFRG